MVILMSFLIGGKGKIRRKEKSSVVLLIMIQLWKLVWTGLGCVNATSLFSWLNLCSLTSNICRKEAEQENLCNELYFVHWCCGFAADWPVVMIAPAGNRGWWWLLEKEPYGPLAAEQRQRASCYRNGLCCGLV